MTKLVSNLPIKYLLIALLVFGVSGCSVITPSAPTQFYVLSAGLPASNEASVGEVPAHIQIGIGPVEIPGYVDRPQMVTIGSGNTLVVADLHHWAEPVQESVKRVLIENVSTLLRPQQVFAYPANFHPSANSLQVSIEIREFIQDDTGMAKLTVSWNVKRLLDNTLLIRNAARFEQASVTNDYSAYAADMSKLLRQLSVEIVKSIQTATVG
ncbi:membrane integrity-associated transporter subunit PqiC [Sneathiella sp.]|jgi:uncharacterized lipoprotein YmbA|uniref:PqiC family protein n=1 Tax=Sneathiella sp. TaxID=1964365 RepID=UPI0039E39650